MNHIGSQSNAPKIPIDDGAYTTRRMEDCLYTAAAVPENALLLCCLDVMETIDRFHPFVG